jgi:hypothetical protein
MSREFFQIGKSIYGVDDIARIDISRVSDLKIRIFILGSWESLSGIEAMNFLLDYYPRCLEGERLLWAKNSWALHNLVGHPLMQLFSFFGMYKLAMRVHDSTVPRPKGIKEKK